MTTKDTIRMESFASWFPDAESRGCDDERTIVTVFTGEQWEQFGPHYDSIHDALQAMDSLRKWRDREVRRAAADLLDESLNSGDGSYRP